MISYVELFIGVVYFAMAGYIMYLQYRLHKAERAGEFLTMVLHDIVHNEVKIERTDDGFKIIRNPTA